MAASHSVDRTSSHDTTQTLKRRGLLAAAVAFAAGLVAKLSETAVSAGNDGDVVLGASNTTSGSTAITSTAGTGLSVSGESGYGLFAEGAFYGVFGVLTGSVTDAAGVRGAAHSPSAYGVSGANASGTAVRGESETGLGIHGTSTNNSAVLGQVPASSNANVIAIYAQNYSTYAGPGPGAGGFAVYGLCAKGHGLVGATATAGGAAVVGATNGVAGAYAAAFYGPVIVGGDFTVVGGAKSAAVPHPDGSHRRLYCMESPESWFEDFGTGQLACGRAEVRLDPDFAGVVDLGEYHVFLTEYDQHRDLCVTERTPTGFRVQARDPEAAGPFGWRLVAKRKDITGERLAAVTIPPEPTLPPPMPDVPAARPYLA